jgi:hypothetical protein
LNVEYVLSQQEIDGPGLERVHAEGEVKVYRVGDPLRRAWVVHDAVIADDERAFDLLNAEDFDPRNQAVLPPESAELLVTGGSALGSAAQVVEATPGRLVLDVSPERDGLLVVSQPFYPGWRASVDGKWVPIYRVDYMLQGVAVEAGSHRVELSYHHSLLPAVISLVVLAGCVAGLILALRRR